MAKQIQSRTLTNEEQEAINKLRRSSTEPYRLVERARMIVLAYEGMPVSQIAPKLDQSIPTVYLRLKRFQAEGLDGLKDEPGTGRKPIYTEKSAGK